MNCYQFDYEPFHCLNCGNESNDSEFCNRYCEKQYERFSKADANYDQFRDEVLPTCLSQ